jgi:hypothetical protein
LLAPFRLLALSPLMEGRRACCGRCSRGVRPRRRRLPRGGSLRGFWSSTSWPAVGRTLGAPRQAEAPRSAGSRGTPGTQNPSPITTRIDRFTTGRGCFRVVPRGQMSDSIAEKSAHYGENKRARRSSRLALSLFPYGGGTGTRTPNPLLAKQVRYQLRHAPIRSNPSIIP